MEDQLKQIIDNLEQSLKKPQEAGSGHFFRYAFSYSFINPDNTPEKKLKALTDPLQGVMALLQLMEKYPEVDYYEDPDYLCRYLETYSGQGYEELLFASLQRRPMLYTVYLLDRLVNDKSHAFHNAGLALLEKLSQSTSLPTEVIEDALERLEYFREQERPLEVKPSNYQLLGFNETIARFDLEKLYYRNGGNDSLDDHFNEPKPRMIVFEGDTEFADDLKNCSAPLESDFQKLIYEGGVNDNRIIIVNGNLKARKLDMRNIDCLFVLGDMECEKITFHETNPAFIQGNLTATQAVLGIAYTDDSVFEEKKGRNCACVQGQVYAPRVQTWYMRLEHLNWTDDSGKEFAEDEELEPNDHLKDAIW